jgi:hypothetical protein
MKEENSKHLAVAAAGALDRVAIPESALIEAIEHSTPAEIIDGLCPEYRATEQALQEKIGSIQFERENSELRDLIYNFIDLKALLIWRLAGPVFLRLAGHTDEEIARTCSTFGIGCAPGENRYRIV